MTHERTITVGLTDESGVTGYHNIDTVHEGRQYGRKEAIQKAIKDKRLGTQYKTLTDAIKGEGILSRLWGEYV